ncbi:MAG: PSD1 domain-containing protein [Verrucomicrobia subdivision 3 bacterium]|nr:PSD1 domain-containing protein [Limisphaerales bacterium]
MKRVSLLAALICACQLFAVDFSREILPILSNKCFVCHGPDTKKKDLVRLDSFAGATRDLGGYSAINPKQLGESEILVRLHDAEEPMPPKDAEKQLTSAERALLTQWVKEGGQYAKHWAFVPPKKMRPTWKGNAIDGLVERQLKAKDIGFAPEADKTTLARRAALVLTGLPPEPALLKQFLADKKPAAYERLVDALLVSPRYGEHQARYWLDAVRYGDTHGLHLDNKRGIYPYRDWVVRAFNRNQPLDEFLIWQLAGDLLPEPTLEQQVATGFVRMNPTTAEGGAIPAEFQAKNNFDRVETLGTSLLGMSLVCARCHTHKYDPIPQVEYYQMMAFFNSTAEPSMDGNRYEYGPTVKAPADVAAWDRWEALVKQGDAAAKELEEFKKTFKPTLVARDLPKPRVTQLLDRGEYNLPKGEPLQPDVFAVMGVLPEDAPRNRLGLAQWLTARGHPLVSRVLVNRIWQRTFGQGLVRTPADFGLQGEQPTHPELLDWLAVDLQDRKWDLKGMLKLMVTSRTFKQSSAHRPPVKDPENRLWARGPAHRLDAEALRDVALWASGLLDDTMGGEGVKPYQPSGLWKALMHPASNTKSYVSDKDARQYRRSLYVYWKRTSPHPMMTLFDAPSRESSCVQRSRTSTPTQSLALLNERQRVEMGRQFGQRLMQEAADDAGRLNRLFELVASRAPNAAERAACMGLFRKLKTRYAANAEDAKAFLSIGDSPRDEKLNAADHAAWAQVVITVLASDVAMWVY